MESYNGKRDIFNLAIDEEAKTHLLETVRWTKFLAILGFIFLGLLILFGLLMGTGFSQMAGMYGLASGMGVGFMIIYFIIAMLYFFPIYYLYKYSVLVKPAIHGSNQEQFNLALSYQRRMFKFIGIMALIVLGLYAVMIVFMIIGVAIAGV